MDNTDSKLVGIIGSGTMGSGIALVAATAGFHSKIYDTSPEALQKAATDHKKHLGRLVEKGKLSAEESAGISSRISYADSLKELSNCSLIIEAIVENAGVKQKLFSELETLVSSSCILASNTSSLSITSIGSSCKMPERFVGIHFFNPAPLMPLVEIIPGLATSREVLDRSKAIIDGWGKITVVAKDTPGFIVNRIARPFYGEAIRIYEERWNGLPEGEAGLATIDWAVKEIGGFKMGPFELMDLIGNDVNYTVTETVWTQFFYDARYKPSLTQKRLFEAKRFGRKTGRGYYSYAENAVQPSPVKDEAAGQKIFIRVLSMLINEAADALYLNIASRDDIDTAMTKGVNYPKGLLKWCDEIGAQRILDELTSLRNTYFEERYRPSILLQQMAKDGKRFY